MPTAQVATRAWTVGTTQLTSPTSVEPIPPLFVLSKGATKLQSGKSSGAFIPILWKLSKISVSEKVERILFANSISLDA